MTKRIQIPPQMKEFKIALEKIKSNSHEITMKKKQTPTKLSRIKANSY